MLYISNPYFYEYSVLASGSMYHTTSYKAQKINPVASTIYLEPLRLLIMQKKQDRQNPCYIGGCGFLEEKHILNK